MTQHLGERQSASRQGVVVELSELMALQYGAVLPRPQITRQAPVGGSSPPLSGLNSQGLAYVASRPHQNGDDIRAVDWRQTARRGRLYTKQFAEEHERPVRFLVDMGASMRFATRVAFKSVIAARLAASLAWRVFASGERVGGQAWTGRDRPPAWADRPKAQGLMPLLRQFADASAERPSDAASGIDGPLQRLASKTGMGACIVISDFSTLNAETERSLLACARRAHLLMIHVYDPFEQNPPPGIYRLSNGRDTLTLNLHPGQARDAYIEQFARRRDRLQQLARSSRASYLPVATDADLPGALRGVWARTRS